MATILMMSCQAQAGQLLKRLGAAVRVDLLVVLAYGAESDRQLGIPGEASSP
ncbi:hypothetical protein HaLaN_05046 [Haematococcus lacustris]|uniref:Uncharacterized protein n=1 Tax=Haematococcus lacustris TaxID=44745 RepID=A0A699YI09_HAELA|nr:hypothetical protein HaLaN_05046 [Haematococcus lacustris]